MASKKQANGNGSDKADGYRPCSINLRTLAAASIFASKDEARYYLNGVCVEIERRAIVYVGTDGHRLVCQRKELTADARENLLTGAFIVPTPYCKHFKLDKDDEGNASMYLQHGRLTIAHNMVDVTFAPIEGVYPNWRRSIPKKSASGVIAQFNFKMLDDFRKFAEAQDLPTPFLAPNGDGPAFLWFAGRPDVLGIVMPHKNQEQMHRKPQSWVLRGCPEREQSDIEDGELLRHPCPDEAGAAASAAPAAPSHAE